MTLQDLISDALDEGLECASTIHEGREAVINTDDQQSVAWITFLTRAGFAFSDPVSCYAIPGGTACEAKDAGGRRVVLRMLREAWREAFVTPANEAVASDAQAKPAAQAQVVVSKMETPTIGARGQA